MNGETRADLRATIRKLAATVREQDKELRRLQDVIEHLHGEVRFRKAAMAQIREIVS